MKLKEKEFAVYDGKRPKVLLIGNGINRAFNGKSWDKMLDDLKDPSFTESSGKFMMPMPLKAALLTKNDLSSKLKCFVGSGICESKSSFSNSLSETKTELKTFLKKLIDLQFNYILTTNYTYEIESTLLDKLQLKENDIKNMMCFYEIDGPQKKYLLNTFNHHENDDKEYFIWHIHGEARKPNTMVIGHDFYGRLLSKYIQRTNKKKATFKKNFSNNKNQKIGSWIDAFLLGDVYIVGLGLDFSELDLWWLLDYKGQFHKTVFRSGQIVYYDPYFSRKNTCFFDRNAECSAAEGYVLEKECKHLLLEVDGVEVRNPEISGTDAAAYRKFYEGVLLDIKKSLEKGEVND